MIRALSSYVALTVACLLTAPVASGASPLDIPSAAPRQFRAILREKLRTSDQRRSADSLVKLPSQHGYRLMILGEGNLVALVVMRHSGGSHLRLDRGGARKRAVSRAVTAYVTRGTVTPTRIKGSFGPMGSVAVRFHPSGRTVKEDPGRCRGHSAFTLRYGTFAGHIRFTGEDRYLVIRAHRAKGKVRTPRHLRCRARHPIGRHPRERSTSSRHAHRAEVFVEDHMPTASTELIALQADRLSLLLALSEESSGRMAVFHYVLALSERQILTHDDALTSATLRPPRPFHGKGVYSAGPDGTKTWGGTLSVAFPGTPKQPMTGPDFVAQLNVGF